MSKNEKREINRFEWCDDYLPILRGVLHPDDVLIFDHRTGIAYTGDMMGCSGDLTQEICRDLDADQWETAVAVPLYLEKA